MIGMMDQQLTIPAKTIYAGDVLAQAVDRLGVIHLALTPENETWHDTEALFAVWGTLEHVIKDINLVRERLQHPPAEEPVRQEARA